MFQLIWDPALLDKKKKIFFSNAIKAIFFLSTGRFICRYGVVLFLELEHLQFAQSKIMQVRCNLICLLVIDSN